MALIQAVDLASRYSASCIIDETGAVVEQFDSWRGTRRQFVSNLIAPFAYVDAEEEQPLVLGIEDLPHSLRYGSIVKEVCRLQGMILDQMDWHHSVSKILFIPPTLWQIQTPGVYRKGPKAPIEAAKDLYGYEVPDLGLHDLHGKDRTTARKVQTDYACAYLIARWMLEQYKQSGKFDVEHKNGKTSRVSTW